MKYLFIGAHPDDVEYSCGGTILRLINEGHDVSIVVMTSGGNSTAGTIEERQMEQEKAFAYIGASELIRFGYEDGNVPVIAKTVRELSRTIEDISPDFVITHYPEDSHQDHRAVAAIVKSATRRKYSLLYFDSYSSTQFVPNLYVDISGYVSMKIAILDIFQTQIAKYDKRGMDFIKKSILTNQLNGYECGASYAEAFAIDTYMI